MTPSFTCLIPAYNEAARIGPVLNAVLALPLLAGVIVIDDGSTDDTAFIAQAKGAQVLRTPGNLGKTRALALGLQSARTSHVVLIDADLTGLSAQALTALIDPVLRGTADATINHLDGEGVMPRMLSSWLRLSTVAIASVTGATSSTSKGGCLKVMPVGQPPFCWTEVQGGMAWSTISGPYHRSDGSPPS